MYNNKHISIITSLCRCDRILSYGKGTRLLSYTRAELTLSDHRPVTAFYISEVDVFIHRKFQRALKFTNAEVEDNLLNCEAGNFLALQVPTIEL